MKTIDDLIREYYKARELVETDLKKFIACFDAAKVNYTLTYSLSHDITTIDAYFCEGYEGKVVFTFNAGDFDKVEYIGGY